MHMIKSMHQILFNSVITDIFVCDFNIVLNSYGSYAKDTAADSVVEVTFISSLDCGWNCISALLQCMLMLVSSELSAAYKARNTDWPKCKQPDIPSNRTLCCRTASKPNKPTQKTLDKLFVKGSAQLVDQAKRLGGEPI